MSDDMVATHKGWFLFCPVFLDMRKPEVPGMWARWEWMEPLLSLSGFCQELAIGFLSAFDPDYEPNWVIRVTGEVGAVEL